MPAKPTICIYGAGSIGCYIGARLAASGAEVHLIGRARIADEVAASGLHATDYLGAAFDIAPGAVAFSTDARQLGHADLVLVTVKSAATAAAAADIARHVPPGVVVISFQNGIGNDVLLRESLPHHRVIAGMVQFNVVHRGEGRFHQGSEGGLEVSRDPSLSPFLNAFARAGLPLAQRADFAAVQWAKLLLNLNNAVNALSGIPLKAQLAQRAYRRCTALAQEEGLRVLAAARLRPARLTIVPPAWIPRVLRLPDALFSRVAARMLAIDPLARSSMQDDLVAGRPTEVDWLNGEIVRLASPRGVSARVNQRLVELIHAAECGGRRDWSGDALLAELSGGG